MGEAVAVESVYAAQRKLREWRAAPWIFVRQCLRAEPDGWQDQVLHALIEWNRIAMRACVGPGKSAVLSWCAWWFLAVFPYPKIAATSITWDNLKDNLWAEMAKWQRQSEFLSSAYTWTQTKIFANDHPEEWWMSARSWSRSATPEIQGNTLAGLHADHVMAIADESGGMPASVVSHAEGILANLAPGRVAKLIQAGNPTHLSGPLYDACHKNRAHYGVVEVTGDPDRADRAPRVSLDFARDMIAMYGRKHPVVRARVLGLFPLQATDALVGLDKIEDSYGRTHTPANVELLPNPKTLGVDVARYGSDDTVVAKRDGQFHRGFERWSNRDTEYTADRTAEIADTFGAEEIRVDDVGVGGGVTDKLKRLDRFIVHGVNVGEAPTRRGVDGRDLYKNLKAQVNFEVAALFNEGTISLDESIRESKLSEQATDILYKFAREGGVLQIEAKDDFKARHNGTSPDDWDATVLAFHEAPRIGGVVV